MQNALYGTFLVEIIKYAGPSVVIIAGLIGVGFLFYRHWLKGASQKQDKDRKEHMAKWDSMVAAQKEMAAVMAGAHKDELDRMFKLHERQAEAQELQIRLLAKISEKIDSNQYCPMVRGARDERTPSDAGSPRGG